MIIAVYGKGGIGKSTIASNISALLGNTGKRVLQVGCDPKHDSTFILAGRFITTVSDVLVDKQFDSRRVLHDDIVFRGRFGTSLVEVGGPEAGKGCGGYVVGDTIEILKRLEVFEQYDHIVFDVLGDVVCGGFAVPMNLARIVYVVAGNDFNSIFAANRIHAAVVEKSMYYPVRLGGIIGNKCDGEAYIREFCALSKSELIASIPFSQALHQGRMKGKTFLEMKENGDLLSSFKKISSHIQDDPEGVIPDIVPDERLFSLFAEGSDAEHEHQD